MRYHNTWSVMLHISNQKYGSNVMHYMKREFDNNSGVGLFNKVPPIYSLNNVIL